MESGSSGTKLSVFSYNQDNQLTQAGNLNIHYNTENGLLNSASLGNLGTSNSYNAFGELASYSADYFSTASMGSETLILRSTAFRLLFGP